MRFEHRAFDRGGDRLHEIVDLESGYHLQVKNLGAELISIASTNASGEKIGFLYRDAELDPAPSGWQGHATVMGYYLHRLKGEQTLYAGDQIKGGNHGFLRHKRFPDPEVKLDDRATLTYSLTADSIQPVEYPRRVSFKIDYTLIDNSVEVTFRFQNEEQGREAHVSFGLHPGFAVSSVESARIILPKGSYRRFLAPDNFLSGETVDWYSDGGPLPIRPFELPGSFLMEALEVEHLVARLQDPGKRLVEIDLSESPYFTLWSDLHPFLCIEPCWGLPDHQQQRPFEQKLGTQVIPPGQSLVKRFTMRFTHFAG